MKNVLLVAAGKVSRTTPGRMMRTNICPWKPGIKAPGRAGVSPRNRLLVPEEAAGRDRGLGREPDDRLGPFLGRPLGARAAHVGLHPAGADRVDPDAGVLQLVREDPRQG